MLRDVSEPQNKRTESTTAARGIGPEVEQSELLARIVETTDDAIISLALDGSILTWNAGAEKLYGYQAEEMIGRSERELIPQDRLAELAQVLQSLKMGLVIDHFETSRLHKSGIQIPVSITVSPITDRTGKIIGGSKIARDISSRVKAEALEQQLRQSRKLEAIGQLAGGVAHEFNNLLMVISSYAEIVRESLPSSNTLQEKMERILEATERGKAVTQQLLAFSTNHLRSTAILDFGSAIQDSMCMIAPLLGEDISISYVPPATPLLVEAELSQVAQVLVNLCLNSRDAMPLGGKLRIRVFESEIPDSNGQPAVQTSEMKCACLEIIDSGSGISEAIQEKVFEPFFTTKPVGKGTGLGLSTVYGIVKQSGGHIEFQSNSSGTRFAVYFPLVADKAKTRSGKKYFQLGLPGKVLVVEDEAGLRESISEYLRMKGHTVTSSPSADEAIRIVEGGERFDALLTDIVMPGMDGRELARKLLSKAPKLRVLYMSGYAEERQGATGVDGSNVMRKPFSLAQLSAKLDMILGRS